MKQPYAEARYIGALCAALCAVMLFFTACARNADLYPSISAISVSWLNLKSGIMNTEQADSLHHGIKDFRLTIYRFSSSPIGYLYKIQRPENLQILADIDSAADRLDTALKEGGGLPLFPIMLEIDSNLEQLQLIEKSLSDASQHQYFWLFFFLTVFIIIIVLALWALYGRFENAQKRERQSLVFSRETIIAQEQERLRIARELHDTVAQDLWRLSFQTEIMEKTAESADRSRLCAEVVKGQKEVMQRVRSICDNLIPPDFHLRRFDDALRNLCYSFEQRTGIECQLFIDNNSPTARLDSDMQLQSFRIVQECLTNIEKHAGATETSVIVRNNKDDNELLICISDNGKGFSQPDRDSGRKPDFNGGRFGLRGIYDRAASISAFVTIDSEEGEGTMVTMRIPFNPEEK